MWVFLIALFFFLLDTSGCGCSSQALSVATVDIVLHLSREYSRCHKPSCKSALSTGMYISSLFFFFANWSSIRGGRIDSVYGRRVCFSTAGRRLPNRKGDFILSASAVPRGRGIAPWSSPAWETNPQFQSYLPPSSLPDADPMTMQRIGAARTKEQEELVNRKPCMIACTHRQLDHKACLKPHFTSSLLSLFCIHLVSRANSDWCWPLLSHVTKAGCPESHAEHQLLSVGQVSASW